MAVTPSTPAPRLTFTASLVVAEVVVVATNCLPRNCLAKRAVSFRESLEHIFIIHFFSALPFHPHFSTHFSHTFSFRYIIFITSSLTAFRCIHYLSSRFLLLFYLITSLHYTHPRTHTHTLPDSALKYYHNYDVPLPPVISPQCLFVCVFVLSTVKNYCVK